MSRYTSNHAEGTGYRWVEGPDGKEICSFSTRIQDTPEGSRRFIDLDNAEENARFIADALNKRDAEPELYEALEDLVLWFDAPDCTVMPSPTEKLNRAFAALSKARGEAS